MTKGTVAISLDLDWAPEAVLADTLDLLARYSVPATIFATHASPVLQAGVQGVEVGVHPNFNLLLNGPRSHTTVDTILSDLRSAYPDARGVRSHSMLHSTPLLYKFVEHDFSYEANCFLPYDSGLRPQKLWVDLIRVPYNWEDDVHWSYGYGFDDLRLTFGPGSLNVLDFHPIHLFLNTESAARYDAAKAHYQDVNTLQSYRNHGPVPGARDVFIKVLGWCSSGDAQAVTLRTLAEQEAARA